MSRDSKTIKSDLADDLASYSSLLTQKQTDGFLVEPEELDQRDDVEDRHVSVYFGSKERNISVDSRVPYSTIQEIILQVYVQSHRLKDSEEVNENLYDDLTDDIFDWIYDLAETNRISVVNSKLRVPRPAEGNFFLMVEEPVRRGKSTFTRIRFQAVRKSK